ncbi:peptidoglycan D,D-transpeptidase FtsI family protein [Brevibacillus sp. SIMBA_040]|uniref:peptidoglycan D,D-transpeptidase FtsI family protein n=1 Tax=unclassified Brevibacillus TaxID=2684853 RepID=UPI00397962FF
MMSSSEEKEISTLIQSFPSLRMEEDKQREIAGQIRQEKGLLTRIKRRKLFRNVIGGMAASMAILLIAYQVVISPQTSSVQSAQTSNTPESPSTTAAGTNEKNDKVTTINPQIQAYVEAALDKTNEAFRPERMTVIVTDPHTGEILAMANRTSKELAKEQAYAIRALPDPVTTFPIVALAAAIQEGKFDSREIFDSGTYEVSPGKLIKDHNNGIGWGKITYLEGIQRSSNVAYAKLGNEQLKKDLLQEYLNRFGFGNKTGIELEDEEAGTIPPMENPYDVAAAALGQGASATAMQQVAAMGAIANGGELMKPHLYKQADTDTRNHYIVRQVISEETAREVREILESSVTMAVGSNKTFKMDEYSVAGKSGVAPKYDVQGNVIEGKYIASFIGFAPIDNPRLLISVSIDEPKTDLWFGLWWRSIVSPLFKEIMENSLRSLQQQ